MPIQTKNPATGKLVKTFEELTDAELEVKLQKAVKAFVAWKKTTIPERAKLLRNMAAYLRSHAEELSALQTLEMGKTLKTGPDGIEKCAQVFDYYAENGEKMLAPETISSDPADLRYVRFDPLGVILAVMPWNFPFWQLYRGAAPALMAGNVVLLKHASNVPQCAQAIEKSFIAAGFPRGVFQNLFLNSKRVEKLIRDPRVAAVTLTGSDGAGSAVARVAGDEIKKVVLELGGNDPFIVFPDADITRVAAIAAKARLAGNVGQSCNSAKRFLVHKKVAKEFTAALVREFEKLTVGDPTDPATDVGPLALPQVLEDVERQVKESVAKGAKVLLGGKRIASEGYFYPPTILTHVKKGMPAYHEEVFGPVASLITFETEAEAVHIANDSRFGLGASVYTKDRARIDRLIPLLEAGNVFANEPVRSDPKAPFGGIKRSGIGRELSLYGIREFVNIKNVRVVA